LVLAHRVISLMRSNRVGLGAQRTSTSVRHATGFAAVSSGGRFSGERGRQSDFLIPYLKAVFGTIGPHDLTFFSVKEQALVRML
jgi:FMN-dependent NADH-azoreductase